MEMKFCRDCVYIEGIFCKRTEKVEDGFTDLVTGISYGKCTRMEFCITERLWSFAFPFSRNCGKKGRYWVRREE